MSDEMLSSNYLTSGSIYFTGLGNGTDFDSMVTSLVQIEKRKSQQLEAWKAEWESKNEAFRGLNSSLLFLKTTMESMDTQGEFLIKSVTSSNETALTAAAGSNADLGTHTVEINQLAQNDILVSTTGFSSSTDIVAPSASVFEFTYGGNTVSVDVAANSSLEALASYINASGDNRDSNGQLMVRASLVNDGNNYYLQLRGMDLGSDNQVVVLDPPANTLAGFASADFDQTQNAQNAQIRVDGWPTGTWIERSTNVIDDVVSGITLTLKESGSTVRINTENNLDAIREKIETFVSGYNDVMGQIQALTKVNQMTNQGSLLTGNYGLQMISQNLKNIVASKATGFDYDDDKFLALGGLGITTDTDQNSVTFGLLKIDWDILNDALEKDAEGVSEVFGANLLPAWNSTDFRYYSAITGITKAGVY
ncbi:MAG: flagellar hook protein, partial [Deltaproteobacteria bacterium]|nr:flagellar hook protein [Deltaproteobacteria bacterium]